MYPFPSRKRWDMSHRIHGTGIFTYIYHTNQLNVGKYTSPMDPMGVTVVPWRGQTQLIPQGIIIQPPSDSRWSRSCTLTMATTSMLSQLPGDFELLGGLEHSPPESPSTAYGMQAS